MRDSTITRCPTSHNSQRSYPRFDRPVAPSACSVNRRGDSRLFKNSAMKNSISSKLAPLFVLLVLDIRISALILGPSVECPNKAQHCSTETFNYVLSRLGCLGCQVGCQPGFVMTANPRHYTNDPDPDGTYVYQGVEILKAHNVSEPQWLCSSGQDCLPGYFQSNVGSQKACAWCGEGCSKCRSFNNCQTCFAGYRLNPHTLPGGKLVTTCTSNGVMCPRQPSNCLYKVFLTSGAGCPGCQSCESGFLVTFNPNYFRQTNDSSGTYDYQGVHIRNGFDVMEPRYVCVYGHHCPPGFYERMVGTVAVCEWCEEGCDSCKTRGQCDVCKATYSLQSDGSCLRTN